MRNVSIFLLSVVIPSIYSYAQEPMKDVFLDSFDIGNPIRKGISTYDSLSQTYSIKGGGYNIWFDRDEFYYLYNSIQGDFILTANFDFVGKGVDPHRKVGWMIRESLAEQAAHISATLHGDGLTALQWRELPGDQMRSPQNEIHAPQGNYSIMQLERKGKMIIMRAAHTGDPLQIIGTKRMNQISDRVLAGLFICSHNPDVVEEAKVWNVRIDRPVEEDYNPYQKGFLGSRLEVINVFEGNRRVIYQSGGRFEAPNWMPEGDKLLFNMDGFLYTIPVKGGAINKLNTGAANQNNNDHGISFDGKLLAISSSHEAIDGGGSAIYVLPLTGGVPKLVTHKTPSYWHGWNPNNREVVYVAKRSDTEPYNIYSADIRDGKEKQVTMFDKGHVDGPEFSPDGKFIYYNGSQSGTMQIWRMKPDGTGNEQLTFNKYNNWFPHISPDGRWLVYLSFPETIDVNDHPFYKRVTINLMPANGGESKVIAYLYGGQGTINVPSWSPDSKSISFVSNSGKN